MSSCRATNAKAAKSEKTVGGVVDNRHPTVKSVELMRWLTRLVTPPGGLVLDPFMGSGTTGVACAAEGFRFLGVERGEHGGQPTDHEYITTAAARLAHAYGASMTDDDDDVDDGTQLRPFVKWVGGKRRQAPALAAWCTERLARTPGARYIEPFLGGGAVALTMPPGTPMLLADLCLPLGWLWWWVQQEPERIATQAAAFGCEFGVGANTAEGYAKVRLDHNLERYADVDHMPAARFLWLNHACHGGLYRENQDGLFNVPWGRRPHVAVPTATHLRAVAARIADADIRPGWDFEDVLDEARAGDVAFIDSPYDADALAFTTYVAQPFGPAAQERLAACVWRAVKRGVHVIGTNADTPRVRQLYDGLDIATTPEARSIGASTGGAAAAPCVTITSR